MSSTEEVRYHTQTNTQGELVWTATTRWFSTGAAASLEDSRAMVLECLEDHFEKALHNFKMNDDLIVYRHSASPQARETFRLL